MMQPAKLPKNERARLLALKNLKVLDSPHEPLFDEITRLASKVCDVPIALISLVDDNRQWIKANTGLKGTIQIPRKFSFCAHTILANDIMEISDAKTDTRFDDNPLVRGAPNICFYAGVPLNLPDGENIGTLCVIDKISHTLNERQRVTLVNLAKVTVQALLSRSAAISALEEKSFNLTALVTSANEEYERRKVTMNSISDAVITTDKHGNIEYLNQIAEELTGWQDSEAYGLPIQQVFNIINESSKEKRTNPVEACLSENRNVGPIRNTILINRDGTEYGIEDSAAPIHALDGEIIGVVLVFRDVTLQRLLSKEMSYRASHDKLTGLINRSEFEHRLEQALINSQEQAIEHVLLYIDIDQFKIVNETSGHNAGDDMLKEITKIVRNCIRTTDAFARIGGDEFGILLEKCNADNAMRIAQTICKSVDEYRFLVGDRRFHLSASIGLVVIDNSWASIDQLLLSADQACYAAKEAGRNRVHLYFHKDQKLEARRGEAQWASQIEQAIEDNKFVLYCQRILPLNAKKGVHGEILLRLKDEDEKLIPPGAFLPAAERYHMASRIDKWVVNEVFSWIKSHHDALDHIETVSINLSGQSLGDHNFHDYVINLLKNTSIDSSKICFEITETAAITNIKTASKFIDSMKKHQIRFSLDDFGSGVSSFGYLKNLAVDYIKIDGQFIKDLISDPIDQATVRCITEVAKVTGKKTIAEWVEHESAEIMLKKMEIDYTQGYFRHKPAPLDYMLDVTCAYQH